MTQEDKELLLKDLCARLPYDVLVEYAYNAFDVHNGNYIKHGSKRILNCYLLDVFISPRQNEKGEYIKPYLRPMSSMTVEEEDVFDSFTDTMFRYGKDNNLCCLPLDAIQWLLKNHFDFMGLIPKGLAIEVTENNNPYKL